MSSWYDPFNLVDTMSGSNAYSDASKKYDEYFNKGIEVQQPFYNTGVNSLAPYYDRLQQMSDPQAYYNSIMGGYNASPYSQIQQQQSMDKSNNMASMTGMSGSTPMAMQMQQNAADISTQDMDKYYNNVYGVNQDYMKGLNSLINGGQQSANTMSGMYGNAANAQGAMAYGETASKDKMYQQMLGGLFGQSGFNPGGNSGSQSNQQQQQMMMGMLAKMFM